MTTTIISKISDVFLNSSVWRLQSCWQPRIDYCNCLLYGVNKYHMAKLQKIRNDLCRINFRLHKTRLPICKNYIGSPFHTSSCSNIILLHSRLSNSPNPHTYHLQSNPVALLVEICSLFPQFVPRSRGFAMASPTEWNRTTQSFG